MWRGWRRLLFPALMRSVRRARRRSALLREMNSLETWERDALRRDLRRVCAQCQSADRCAEEVDRGSAPSSFGEFCPNAHTLAALKQELPADGSRRFAKA